MRKAATKHLINSVTHYRTYLLDDDGQIKQAIDLMLKDDATAIEAVKQLVDGHDVELWKRDRRIAYFKRQEPGANQ
jgi:hypothetical protein